MKNINKNLKNKILFKNFPYPKGHDVKEFVWSGRIDKNKAIWFDFHLETEKYYAETGHIDTESNNFDYNLSDWESGVVWENYHSCKLSSTY